LLSIELFGWLSLKTTVSGSGVSIEAISSKAASRSETTPVGG